MFMPKVQGYRRVSACGVFTFVGRFKVHRYKNVSVNCDKDTGTESKEKATGR